MSEPRIVRLGTTEPLSVSPVGRFTAPTAVRRVSAALGASTMNVNYLTFEHGVRSCPHVHDADQILVYTEGVGVVATDGDGDIAVEVGEIVLLPANVIHMHGAAAGHRAAHLSLMPVTHTTEWDVVVPEGWLRFLRGEP